MSNVTHIALSHPEEGAGLSFMIGMKRTEGHRENIGKHRDESSVQIEVLRIRLELYWELRYGILRSGGCMSVSGRSKIRR
jgi:hypothetical protein